MIKTSAPGRIGLFGEHQDYLNLPVITAAINLYITISGESRYDRIFNIDLPDIKTKEQFVIPEEGKELVYVKKRDYFRSVYNVLCRHGVRFEQGCDCRIEGNIPINSGTSSSSALCVAWTRFLLKISTAKEENCKPTFIARIAYLAEVKEFSEPGGMMDQNASALGGILYQDFKESLILKNLPVKLGVFVLGDSLQSKDTVEVLKRVKFAVLDVEKKIRAKDTDFKLKSTELKKLAKYKSICTKSHWKVLHGAILNRDITRQALKLFESEKFDEKIFGKLMIEHQSVLANYLRISTTKIDRMLQVAMDAGAYGGKINGSGGGGCMFVYAPENPQKVADAIEREGGKSYIITVTE